MDARPSSTTLSRSAYQAAPRLPRLLARRTLRLANPRSRTGDWRSTEEPWRNGIELTSAGKAFLEHARMALLQAEAAKEVALRAAQPAKPTFALGFLSGVEIGSLPEVNRVLRDEFPGAIPNLAE
jgi:hypothetical protein